MNALLSCKATLVLVESSTSMLLLRPLHLEFLRLARAETTTRLTAIAANRRLFVTMASFAIG